VNKKMFLLALDYEPTTIWKISDEVLLELIKATLRTVGAGYTQGPIPKVTARMVRDGGEVVQS
jgi:hypothetical protein